MPGACRHFFGSGCRLGRDCHFSHEVGAPAAARPDPVSQDVVAPAAPPDPVVQDFVDFLHSNGGQIPLSDVHQFNQRYPQHGRIPDLQEFQRVNSRFIGFRWEHPPFPRWDAGKGVMFCKDAEHSELWEPPVKRKLCSHFLKGACDHGAQCTFAHGEHELGQPIPEVKKPAASAKWKLCVYFQQGTCANQNRCHFAHGDHEIGQPIPEVKNFSVNTKRKLCSHFLEGHCRHGASCTFAHGDHEIGQPIPEVKIPAGPTKRTLCQYFLKGFCDKKDMCSYAHGEKEIGDPIPEAAQQRQERASTPCKFYFEKGQCNSGLNCLYSHGNVEDSRAREVAIPVKMPSEEETIAAARSLAQYLKDVGGTMKVNQVDNFYSVFPQHLECIKAHGGMKSFIAKFDDAFDFSEGGWCGELFLKDATKVPELPTSPRPESTTTASPTAPVRDIEQNSKPDDPTSSGARSDRDDDNHVGASNFTAPSAPAAERIAHATAPTAAVPASAPRAAEVAVAPVPVAPKAPPAIVPKAAPIVAPKAPPTLSPKAPPTLSPTAPPTLSPTAPPTLSPTAPPTLSPTAPPTLSPTAPASLSPTAPASLSPTAPASLSPTAPASLSPTAPASLSPTALASLSPIAPAPVSPIAPAPVSPAAPANLFPTPHSSAAPAAASPCASAAPTKRAPPLPPRLSEHQKSCAPPAESSQPLSMARPREAQESLSTSCVAEREELRQTSSTPAEAAAPLVDTAPLGARPEVSGPSLASVPCPSSMLCSVGPAPGETKAQTTRPAAEHAQARPPSENWGAPPKLDQNGDMLLSGEDSAPVVSDGVQPDAAQGFRLCSIDEPVQKVCVRDLRYPCSWMTLVDPEPVRARLASAEQHGQILVVKATEIQGKWFALDPQLLLALKIVDSGRKSKLTVGVDALEPPASLAAQMEQGLSGLYVRLMS